MSDSIAQDESSAKELSWVTRLSVIVTILVSWIATVVASHLRYTPPSPAPEQNGQFSAVQAEPILQQLVGDGIPHPAGSPQNQVVRERILELFRQFGYQPKLHQTSKYSAWRQQQVPLVNIMARLPGTHEGKAVMLAAHYDSVPFGPGACDDGVGVAALMEIARMFRQEAPPRNDVIFLITDGEELGLLGAQAFVEEHPWAKEIGVVVNLEARGTSGPSLMFETSDDSRWLVDLFANHVPKPFTSSLFYEIYRRLPNDTDFTVFRRAGMQGYNFAFIGDADNYHTPGDNFENADRGSLQHHGDNAWSLMRELAGIDLSTQPTGRAVYFDWMGCAVIWWPQAWTLWLGTLGAGLVALALVLGAGRRRDHKSAAKAAGLAALAVVGSLAIMIGVLLTWNFAMSLDGLFENKWVAEPVCCALTFWTVGLCTACLLAWLASIRCSPLELWGGVWSVWALLALATGILLPGASYLWIVPTVVASGVGVALGAIRRVAPTRLIAIQITLSAIAAGALWLPMERLFYDAVGYGMNAMLVVRVTLVLSTLLPALALAGNRLLVVIAAGSGAVGVISTVAAVVINKTG